jgi:O-antigen/teichoic acid export membrane protein
VRADSSSTRADGTEPFRPATDVERDTGGGEADTAPSGAPLRRALLVMTVSSFLTPAAGVLTQPILARGLGVDGRGELAAAMAPHLLAVVVATLGLPEALTYYLAKHPSITRRALFWTVPFCVCLSVICLLATLVALPFLSTGDPRLAQLILVGVGLTLPALVVSMLRGAAIGRQMWFAVAAERLISVGLRVVIFVALLLLGKLTVLAALLVLTLAPIAAGAAFWRLLRRPPSDPAERPLSGSTVRLLVSYGNRLWLGTIVSMLLSRMDQILMAPLSSVADVGLYSVANTISDLPLLVTLAIAGALFGVNSKERDSGKLVLTARLTLLVNGVGCVFLALTLPWWVVPLFGAEFGGAVVPTQMLLISAVICTPGLMANMSISAWGRPGLRSAGLAITLVVNLSVFVLLVPRMGVIGACWTSILTNAVMASYMIVTASRLMQVRVRDFVVVRTSDLVQAQREVLRLLAHLRRRRVAAGA